MAQAITPALLDLIAGAKLHVGSNKYQGEIEIDYVIPGYIIAGPPTDLAVAGATITVSDNHALGAEVTLPVNPANAIDGNGGTYSVSAAGNGISHFARAPRREWHLAFGAPVELTSVVLRVAATSADWWTWLGNAVGSDLDPGHEWARVQYSTDDTNWTDIARTSHTGLGPDTITCDLSGAPITAQFWRIYVQGMAPSRIYHAAYLYGFGTIGIPTTVVDATHGTSTYQVATLGLDRSRKMAAAQLDVTLDNEDGVRGWYQQVTQVFVPNNPIRAFAWYGDIANRVQVFTGLLDRTHDHRNPKTLGLKARSRMKWLLAPHVFVATASQVAGEEGAVRTEANGVFQNKTIEYIVGAILDLGGWPTADRDIAITGITLPEYVLTDKASWAEQITGSDRLGTAAGCDLVEDELGVIHFQPSPLVAAVEPTPAWQFAPGVNVLSLDHEADDEARATRVLVSGPMTSSVPIWEQVWSTSQLAHPAGAWYDPTDPDYLRVVDGVSKYIYRIRQSDRVIVSKKYLGGYLLGLSGDPTDSTHYYVLIAPWRWSGSTTGNKVRKYLKADNSLVATYTLPDGRWSGMKSDGTYIYLTNYDDGKVYRRSMVGVAVSNHSTTYDGELQDQATGLWLNGTTMGVFFAAHKRFLLMDTTALGTVTGVQSTQGTRLAGGEADTDTDVDLYGVAGKGSFGLTEGMVAKFTLAELVTNDVSALAVDWDLEDALGLQSDIAVRDHVGCPNDGDPHQFEERLATFSMKVVQSVAQAEDVAAAQLSLLSRLRRVLDLATTGQPPVQINDPARYADVPANMDATWVVDSYRAALGAGTYTQSMSLLPWEAP